jgi:4-hydroxybenzoate polyprenyltransferase
VKRLLSILAYGNFIVASSAGALSLCSVALEPFISIEYSLFIFFATWAAYGYMHLQELNDSEQLKHPVLLFTLEHRKSIIAISLFSAIASICILFSLPFKWVLALSPAVLISLFYPSTPIWSKGLRSVPGLKLPLIAFTWAWTCAVVPLIFNPIDIEIILLRSLSFFTWIYALAIAFDLRDVEYDKQSLNTLPQRSTISAINTARVFTLIAALSSLSEHFLLDSSWQLSSLITLPLVLTLMALNRISKKPDALFISFHMEALPILYFAIIWLMR